MVVKGPHGAQGVFGLISAVKRGILINFPQKSRFASLRHNPYRLDFKTSQIFNSIIVNPQCTGRFLTVFHRNTRCQRKLCEICSFFNIIKLLTARPQNPYQQLELISTHLLCCLGYFCDLFGPVSAPKTQKWLNLVVYHIFMRSFQFCE